MYTCTHVHMCIILELITSYINVIRKWKIACLLTWAIFSSYQFIISMDQQFSKHPLCSHSSIGYGYVYFFANVTTLSGFGFTWIVLLTRILRSKSENATVPHWIAFHVASMGLVTAILDIIFERNRICIDVLG